MHVEVSVGGLDVLRPQIHLAFGVSGSAGGGHAATHALGLVEAHRR